MRALKDALRDALQDASGDAMTVRGPDTAPAP
jgi:hypothetical protein